MKIRRIGILTGGGDAPGLNAVIRSAVRDALARGWEVLGIRQGYEGLLKPGLVQKLTKREVAGILRLGGTILGTSNRGDLFGKDDERVPSAVRSVRRLGLDALIVIGGDGSLGLALKLLRSGVRVVGVPKTIDNDVSETALTFGFDTAVSTATAALDNLRFTAQSHGRVMVVEVMGRYAGWIALHAGVAGDADVILLPEIPFRLDSVCAKVRERYSRGPGYALVICAEGAVQEKGRFFMKDSGGGPHLGGVAEFVSRAIQGRTGCESRHLVLGHLQRGGEPTTFDRVLGTRFGAAAVELIESGRFGYMTAFQPPDIVSVPIARAVAKLKRVPVHSDLIRAARAVGVNFGD